jgi:hypothetical protein
VTAVTTDDAALQTTGSDAPLIVIYVSCHGFGHAARVSIALRELHRLAPRARVLVRSSTPDWLYPDDVLRVPIQSDVGVLQRDSLEMLVDETIIHAAEFERARPALVAREVAALGLLKPAIVGGDISPLAFDVAADLGVPGVAIGNFSWDWIYAQLGSDRPELAGVVASIIASERRSTRLLRLPFFTDMSAFPVVEDVPLLARVSRADREATRRRLGLPTNQPVILISYGGFAFNRLKPQALAALPDVTFVTTLTLHGAVPANVKLLPMESANYHDLLAACDAVMMKPGYSTTADCLANRVPMIYTSRPGFGEETVLVDAMERFGRAVPLPPEALMAGDIRPAVEAALACAKPWVEIRTDGGTVIAERILDLADLPDWIDPACTAHHP